MIRIGSGFVVSKVVAIFTGPAGVALLGAFTNFVTIILTFASGALNTGIIKYTAEYANDPIKSKSLLSTSLRITVVCSTIFGLGTFMLSSYCSLWIFSTREYTNVIRVLGVTVLLYSLNSLLIGVLNGRGQIRTYTIVNTLGSVIGLILTIILVYYFKIIGALYALVLAQTIVFFVSLYFTLESPWFSWDHFNQKFDSQQAKKLAKFSLMALVSAVTVPLSQIILRNLLILKLGVESAGQWQGMMRISDGYLMIITTSLSTYYLPKLASLTTNKELKTELVKGLKIILPAVFLGCMLIYTLRFQLIKVLYTKDFLTMEILFVWQLIGDFFKIAAVLIAYLMIAKAMTRYYIIVDLVFNSTYILLGYFFVSHFKLEGITMAFALNYLLCFVTIVFIFRKLFFGHAE